MCKNDRNKRPLLYYYDINEIEHHGYTFSSEVSILYYIKVGIIHHLRALGTL